MRPKKYTIHARDMRTKYSIDTQYEILVRLSLSLFAANPDTYAIIFKDLVSAATNYENMGKEDLMEERLITPELHKEILDDPQVSYYIIFFSFRIGKNLE